jgi:hypothetical protein
MKIEKLYLNIESLTTRPHLSSLTSRADHGNDGADRRYLDDGETNGDGRSTKTLPSTRRIILGHKLDQLRTGPSTTSAMAATTARLCYAGDVRPVKLKQMAQEAPAAHPKRD